MLEKLSQSCNRIIRQMYPQIRAILEQEVETVHTLLRILKIKVLLAQTMEANYKL